MITGSNTDVEYGGKTYHVQTEDRGDEKPIVESLVYCQGEILGSRKTDYQEGLGEEAIADLLDRQHARLIREIRNGLWAPEGPRLVGEEHVTDRGFDEVVADCLASDPEMVRVHLSTSAQPRLSEGTRSKLRVRALEAGKARSPAAATMVTVRAVSAGASPRLLAEGETDEKGWFECEVEPVATGSGRVALVVTSGAVGGGQLRLNVRKRKKAG